MRLHALYLKAKLLLSMQVFRPHAGRLLALFVALYCVNSILSELATALFKNHPVQLRVGLHIFAASATAGCLFLIIGRLKAKTVWSMAVLVYFAFPCLVAFALFGRWFYGQKVLGLSDIATLISVLGIVWVARIASVDWSSNNITRPSFWVQFSIVIPPLIMFLFSRVAEGCILFCALIGAYLLLVGMVWRLIAAVTVGVLVTVAFVVTLSHDHQINRLVSFLDPWSDPLGRSYELTTMLMSISSGGLSGTGIALDTYVTRFSSLRTGPARLAFFLETCGLLGLIVLFLLLALVTSYICFVRMRAQSAFVAYISMAVMLDILLHGIVSIGSTLGLIPTGIGFPFLGSTGEWIIAWTILLAFSQPALVTYSVRQEGFTLMQLSGQAAQTIDDHMGRISDRLKKASKQIYRLGSYRLMKLLAGLLATVITIVSTLETIAKLLK